MAKKPVIYRAIWGKDCSSDELADEGASPAVKAQIDEVLNEIRNVCPKNSFVALLRGDGGWIFVPILGSGGDRSLCTIWPNKRISKFDVLAEEGDKSNSRKLNSESARTLYNGMRDRFVRIRANAAQRLRFTD